MNQALVDPDQLNRGNMLNSAKKLMAAVMQMGASAKMAAASGKEVTDTPFHNSRSTKWFTKFPAVFCCCRRRCDCVG